MYWGEDQNVLVANGFYEVELGRVEPIPPEIFSATEVYLEIQVESDQAMTPRQRILAVPFAFQADLLDGMSSEEFSPRAILSAMRPILPRIMSRPPTPRRLSAGCFSKTAFPQASPAIRFGRA